MTSLRVLLSLACAALVLGAASAVANPLVVARVESAPADAAMAGRLDATLRAEARALVGERLVSAVPPRPEGCRSDEACAAALASAHGARSVVLASYAKRGANHELRVRLHDERGKLVGKAERTTGAPPDARTVRGALAELLSPVTFVGRLRVANAPAGAQIRVDHLPLASAELMQPYALSVGPHVVEVSAPGHVALVREVTIDYDEELALDATLSPEGAAGADVPTEPAAEPGAVPWWPAAVTGAVTVLAGSAALFAGIDWATTAADVSMRDATLQNGESNLDPHHYAASLLPRGIERENLPLLRAAIRTDMVIVAVASTITVVAGAATGALAARWALSEEPEPEAAPTEEAP